MDQNQQETLKLHQKFFLERIKMDLKRMNREQLEEYILELHKLSFGKENMYAKLMFEWGCGGK